MAKATTRKTSSAKTTKPKTKATSTAKPKTTATSSTAAKTTTTPKTTATKTPAPAVTPEPVVVTSQPVESSLAELKKTELLEKVIAASGVPKRDAKPVVEAMLDVLGDSIAQGREVNVQPFGKLKINRISNKSNARVVHCRLRQSVKGEV